MSETSRGSNTADVHIKGAIEGCVTDPVQRGSKGMGLLHLKVLQFVSSNRSNQTLEL